MRKLINWLDNHLLKIGVGFLLAFIPLWPKLPLIDVPHTWVYIRLEDIFLTALVFIWVLNLLKGRLSLKTPLTLPIFLYWLIGGISLVFSLVFLSSRLSNFFPNVAILHWVRRIEYMVIFLIAFSTVKSLKDVYHYLFILIFTVLGVLFYGFGQKLLGFPAFLTMNEEFAKGIPLYLPEGARITSTFAGHYDLAAYLVFVIAILSALIFGVQKKLAKIGLLGIVLLCLFLLLSTASRVSFMVYLITMTIMLWWQKRKLLIIPVILVSILFMNITSGVGERYLKTFRVKQVVFDLQTGKPIATVDKIEDGKIITEAEKSPAEESLPAGSGYIGLPTTVTTAPKTMTVSIIKKQPLATTSGEVASISGSFLIQKALVYDISLTTRIQGEWPRAIAAFKRNPLLGTGYSSINLATDNDYLRMLGETGIFGLLSFLFLIANLAIFIKYALKKITQPFLRSLAIGVAAGFTGLAVNAVLIDIFEASKVAFSIWLILGITLGGLKLYYEEKIPLMSEIKKILFSPLFSIIILFILTFSFFAHSLNNYFVGDDFTWLRWAAQSTFKDIPSFFTNAAGFFYRPVPKIIYLISFTVFWLKSFGYHLLSLIFHFGTSAFLYLFTLKSSRNKLLAALAALIFLIMPSHGESLFWISTIGNDFAALLIIGGLYFFSLFRQNNKKRYYLFSFLLLLLAILSYEGAIVGPLIILWYELTLGQKRIKSQIAFLLLLPAYLLLRSWAGAHGLSGDYNYNLNLFFANSLGNLLGYLGLILTGPNFLSFYDSWRNFGRQYKNIFLLFSGLSMVLAVMIFWWGRRKVRFSSLAIFSFGLAILSLLPFLGLGNITERYSYLSSSGVAIILGLTLCKIYEFFRKKKIVYALLSLILIMGLLTNYYLSELNKTNKDWYKAGEMSLKLLSGLRLKYITLTYGKTFYFVDVPIREGRAWVFPVGLDDALWHSFRDETLKIQTVPSLEQALDLLDKTPNSHVFVFEKGELQEVVREVKQVPIK
ncbi:MAG: O-antigen ligase family protein [Patescibacteria group bacterium]|nr:O-antigen ligase family protein [Patescibacteria group bacterium]MCL5095140.1 O-antigen ligase family protein [Patescibacteria group bacterium]